MSTLVGALVSLKNSYMDMMTDDRITVLGRVMVPIITLLAVVSVISAVVVYFWFWIVGPITAVWLHAVLGFVIIVGLIGKTCGLPF